MIFYYPTQAITMKDLPRLSYLTVSALSLNLNRQNGVHTNTYRLIDILAKEFLRNAFDLDYLTSFRLDNVDFISIDRINRFYVNMLQEEIVYNNAGHVSSTRLLHGYSAYTNTIYELFNCNKYNDFTRHSIPVDLFTELPKNMNLTIESISVPPNGSFKYTAPLIANNSRITIRLLNYNVKIYLTLVKPYLVIKGINRDFKYQEEVLYIIDTDDIVTINEYYSINEIEAIGINTYAILEILPFIHKHMAPLEYKYCDAEDGFELECVYTFNHLEKTLSIANINRTNSFPGFLDIYETAEINLPECHLIDSYHMDSANKTLYIVSQDTDQERWISLFPIIIPFYSTNNNATKSSQDQSVKVNVVKDSVNKKYILTIFPASKEFSTDIMNISIIRSHIEEKGLWESNIDYEIGDLVVHSGTVYICKVDHTSDDIFSTLNFTLQQRYLVENFLLEIISYGIETNRFEIEFSDLFEYDAESIIQIETFGNAACITQILAQDHMINPILSRKVKDILVYNDPDSLVQLPGMIVPVENCNNRLLGDKITAYNCGDQPNLNTKESIIIFYQTSSNTFFLNNVPIHNVFNTFFLDWDTGTIITSDTITHIITNDLSDNPDISLLAAETISGIRYITDDYKRLFVTN
jgi:hypothetical protein